MSVDQLRAVPSLTDHFATEDGDIYKKLKPAVHESGGHHRVQVGWRWHRCHRLVYEAFHGPLPDGAVVRHRNGRPDDNRLSNLELGDQHDNVADKLRHKRPYRKMTGEKAEVALWLHGQGVTRFKIARFLDLDSRTVRRLLRDAD